MHTEMGKSTAKTAYGVFSFGRKRVLRRNTHQAAARSRRIGRFHGLRGNSQDGLSTTQTAAPRSGASKKLNALFPYRRKDAGSSVIPKTVYRTQSRKCASAKYNSSVMVPMSFPVSNRPHGRRKTRSAWK